jgi:dihydroneopterin aldolase
VISSTTGTPPAPKARDFPSQSQERSERIFLRSLELWCRIGVPEEERAEPQKLLLDLTLQPQSTFASMNDEISHTIDYAKLAEELVALAAERPRHLLETLAVDLARWTFQNHPVESLSLQLRKFILPNTEFVGVSLAWTRDEAKVHR